MRYLTDAERRDFADIIKTYIKKRAGYDSKSSLKPFMLTKDKLNLLLQKGLDGSVRSGHWGDPSVKEHGFICRNYEEGAPIFLATRVPAYAGVTVKIQRAVPGDDWHFGLLSQYDMVNVRNHAGQTFSWDIKHALAAIHILENANKVASKMMLGTTDHYDQFVSVLESPVRYLSVSIRPVARLDDPETLEPPFHGYFDRKHQHLLDDLIHSDAISGRSLVFDAVEIVRAKWIRRERFADMFHVLAMARDISRSKDIVVAWEFDKSSFPLGHLALSIFEKYSMVAPWAKNMSLSDVEAVLEGDRLVGVDVLRDMALLSTYSFNDAYGHTSDMQSFIYEGPERVVDPR